jgi:hypothetical protein
MHTDSLIAMTWPALLADLVLILHVLFIGFVLVGLILIVIGLVRRWQWVRNFWFRLAHLLAIGFVVVQSVLGMTCPLTTLENSLRLQAGGEPYSGAFIVYWLHRLIFFEAEPWVFTIVYVTFGLLVLATFIWGRPRWPRKHRSEALIESVGETSQLSVNKSM